MKLYLVQHGEAMTKDEDPERPLSPKGQKDVASMATFLQRAGISASRVMHSGKLRALQTAEILSAALAADAVPEIVDIINPNDTPGSFAWQMDARMDDTLVVGHLPFMAKLVTHLLTSDGGEPLVDYRPGSIVCLEHEEDHVWHLAWMIRPELLAE